MNVNAKEEFQKAVGDKAIRCAIIANKVFQYPTEAVAVLKEGWTAEDRDRFLMKLVYEYDRNDRELKLFGNIWFDDGSWLERRLELDSETWELCTFPEIPEECLQ